MHKDSQKRIIEEGAVYFVTTNTYDKYPYFKNVILCYLFIAQLKLTKILKGFELYAFCVLYDHVHLVIKPSDKYDITKVMFSMKKQYSHSANRVMGYTSLKPISTPPEGEQTFARLPRIKMIEYIEYLHRTYKKKYREDKITTPKFRWQSSYHDHIIGYGSDFENHIDYTRENYKKHYLSEERSIYPLNYKFTSDNFPDLIDDYQI
jgi:REP element-mobilizing transposase RayT